MSRVKIVKEFIIDNFLFGEETPLELDTDFFDKGIIDSTGVIELVDFLEKSFDISVDDEELITQNLSSLQKIDIFLGKKLNQKVA
jgi:acyl carrier protein